MLIITPLIRISQTILNIIFFFMVFQIPLGVFQIRFQIPKGFGRPTKGFGNEGLPNPKGFGNESSKYDITIQ